MPTAMDKIIKLLQQENIPWLYSEIDTKVILASDTLLSFMQVS